MKIGIFHNQIDKINGCYKVVYNLIKGLYKLDIQVFENQASNYNGVIHDCFIQNEIPDNSLVGPEIYVLPSEKEYLLKKYKNWVQPSQWCVNYQKTFEETKNNNLYVWPVGIDTEKFNDNTTIGIHISQITFYGIAVNLLIIQKL